MWIDALIVLALIAANGVFSGAEIATLSVRKTRLRELIESGKRGARAVQALRDQPERFLATVQVAITIISAAAAAFGGEVFAERLATVVARVPALAAQARQIGFVLVVLVIAYLSVVFGELVPKSLALRAAESYSLLVGGLLLGLAYVARPVVWLLTTSSNLVLRLFGDRTSFSEARLSPDELQELVEEAAKTGSLDARTSEIASRAIDFRHLTAVSVMVPREQLLILPRSATKEQTRAAFQSQIHTRIPVYEGTVDNVVGYVALKDLILQSLRDEPFTLEPFVRPALFVPESFKASNLLQRMQQQRGSLALVVDEQGVLLGLVTIEDLIEELVGEIVGEHDHFPAAIRKEGDGAALVLGVTPVREVNRALGLNLPESPSFSTLAGLCIHLAGRIPEQGTRLTSPDGAVLEICEATPRRVRQVRLHPPPVAPAGDSAAERPQGI
ncbi:MAG TPA: hemolysin family protein [Pseudomonadota bacterium]|nr:hemolysin family protein [Pseudomonadota bacterium]